MSRFRIHSIMLVAAAVIIAAPSAPSAEAQQFSAWSAPVPINCDWLPTLPQYLDCLPHPLDVPHVNSPAFDGGPALSWGGTELYFTSQRTGVSGFAGFDLYVSKRAKLSGPQ
jgi:hypothetical protein